MDLDNFRPGIPAPGADGSNAPADPVNKNPKPATRRPSARPWWASRSPAARSARRGFCAKPCSELPGQAFFAYLATPVQSMAIHGSFPTTQAS